MCTLPIIFGVSTVLSAYGTYRQGQAAAASQTYQARIAENNAEATRNQMEVVTAKEAIDKQELKRSVAKQRAVGRTGYAAGGVVLGTGSALNWELDLTNQEQSDLNIISYNAEVERRNLLNQANNYSAQATVNRMTAKDSKAAAILGAGTTLLSGYTTYKTKFE